MEIEKGAMYAVVTGDLVGSTRLPLELRRDFRQLVDHAASELRAFLGTDAVLGIDLFSGDSWQFVSAPRQSLRACLFLRAYIRAHMERADTRCVVGVGEIDFVPEDRVSQGDGEAFRLSGRLLQQIKRGPAMRLVAADPAVVRQWDLPFSLADAAIAGSWTSRRALAVTGELRGLSQEETGRLWTKFRLQDKPVSQATVSRYLEQAHWPVFARFLREFEEFWK